MLRRVELLIVNTLYLVFVQNHFALSIKVDNAEDTANY